MKSFSIRDHFSVLKTMNQITKMIALVGKIFLSTKGEDADWSVPVPWRRGFLTPREKFSLQITKLCRFYRKILNTLYPRNSKRRIRCCGIMESWEPHPYSYINFWD